MSVILGLSGERIGAREGSEESDGKKTRKRVFYIECSSMDDSEGVVLAAPILPHLFDFYQTKTETQPGIICLRRIPKQIGPKHWDVTIEYETPTASDTNNNDNQNEPDVGRWNQTVAISFEEYDQPLIGSIKKELSPADLAGMGSSPEAAVNSAKEPFNPPIVVKKYRPVLTFTSYSSWVDIPFLLDYVGAVNSDVFFGAAPRQFRITGWDIPDKESKTIGPLEVWFYTHKIKMSFKRDTWDLSALNQGTFFLDSQGNKRSFLTKDGHPRLGLLKADGTELDVSGNYTPTFKTFRHFREMPFFSIGLVNSMP